MSQPVLSSGSSTRPGIGRFPLVRTRPFGEESPWDVYRRMAVPHRPSVLLESGKPPDGQARYSYMAAEPYLVFTGSPGGYALETAHGATRHRGDPLPALFSVLGPCLVPRSTALPPFIGGAVGYVSYDAVRHYEVLPSLEVGLTVNGQARWLTLSSADYEEWGGALQVQVDPGPRQEGAQASLTTAYGASGSGVERLWTQEVPVRVGAG